MEVYFNFLIGNDCNKHFHAQSVYVLIPNVEEWLQSITVAIYKNIV